MEPEKPAKTRLLRKIALWTGLFAALLAVLLALGLGVVIARPDLLWPLVQKAVAAAGGTASASEVDLSLWPMRARVENLRLSLPTVDATLAHGAVYPDLSAGRRGKPLIRLLEARGLRVVIKPPGKKEKKPARPPDISGLKNIFRIGRAKISDCDISVPAGGGSASVKGLSAFIDPGPNDTRTISVTALCRWRGARPGEEAGGPVKLSGVLDKTPSLSARLETGQIAVSHPRFSGKAKAVADFFMDEKGVAVSSLKAAVPAADIALTRKSGFRGLPLGLDASLAYPFRGAPSVIVKSLDAGGFAHAQGKASGSKPADLTGQTVIAVHRVKPLADVLAPLVPESARPFDLNGGLRITASMDNGRARVVLDKAEISGRIAGVAVSGLTAGFTAEGPPDGPVSAEGWLKTAFGPDRAAPKPAPATGSASLALSLTLGKDGFDLAVSPASARVLAKGATVSVSGFSAEAGGPWAGPYKWKAGADLSAGGPGAASGVTRLSARGKAGAGILLADARVESADAVFRGLAAKISGDIRAAREGKKPLSVNGDLAFSVAPANGRGKPDDLPPVTAGAKVAIRTLAGKFSATAALTGFSAQKRGLALEGAGTLAASGPVEGPYAVKAGLSASVKPITGPAVKNGLPPVDAMARANVMATVARDRFSAQIAISELVGAMKELSVGLTGRAQASGPFSGPCSVSGNFSAAVKRLDPKKPETGPATASSALSFSGSVGRNGMALAISAADIKADLPGVSARGAAKVGVKGPASVKAAVSGRLTATADLARGKVAARGLSLSAPVGGTVEHPEIKGFSLTIPAGGLLFSGKTVEIGRAAVGGDVEMAGKKITARNLFARSENLGEISARASFSGGKPEGGFTARGLGLERLAAVAAPFTSFRARDWGFTGPVELSGGILPNGLITASASFPDTSLASPDGQVMAQSVSVGIEAKTSLGENAPVTLSLAAKKGEFLYKTLYVDFAKLPFSAKAYGRFPAGAAGVRGLDFKAGVGGLGSLKVTGDAVKRGPDVDFTGKVKVEGADLTGIWTSFIRDTLAASRPGMAGTTLTGGADLSLDVAAKKGITDVSGRLSVRDMAFIQKDGTGISGLSLTLPLSYRFGAGGPNLPETMPDWGSLSIKRIVAGPVTAGPYLLSVALLKNRFWVKEDIVVPVFGSRLSISGIRVSEPLSPGFSARLSARLDEIDMARLPSGVPLTGKIGGTLSPITATRRKVVIGGGLEGSFFGGKLSVTDLSVADPLGLGRTIGASVSAAGVDLKPFTTALGAGLILGSVDITAKNVAIAQGQPVAFDLAVRSVPRKGVPQKVTLEAVNSIAVVSSGSGLTGFGVNLMTRVFDAFPYEAMGFSCALRNDTFSVRGLVREGGTEYLVKRPLIRGINVINRNLENRISFSDMLERIQRVRGNGKGPEVKVGGK